MMGAILEPTRAMGPWRVEMRSSSAYLTGAPMRGHRPAQPIPDGMNALGFAVQRAGLPALLAAIEQMIAWGAHDCIDAEADYYDPWAGHTTVGDWCQFHGPVYVYGLNDGTSGQAWVDSTVIEFDYHDLGCLREQVIEAIG